MPLVKKRGTFGVEGLVVPWLLAAWFHILRNYSLLIITAKLSLLMNI